MIVRASLIKEEIHIWCYQNKDVRLKFIKNSSANCVLIYEIKTEIKDKKFQNFT